MTKILITGGSGLVGKPLCKKLQKKGYEVTILSRYINEASIFPVYTWNIAKNEIDSEIINSVDYIIHLAGVNISEKRWSTKQKKLILESRTKSGELIFNHIDKKNNQLKAFITASAIGFYGTITTAKIFDEKSPAADDFLGQTCKKWEQVCDKFTAIGVRTAKIRTGIVLTEKRGALSKIITPIKLGLGSAIGTGKQFLPWIHIDDLCNIYIKAVEDKKMIGAFNAVAPEQVTNHDFTKKVSMILNKPFWFPRIPSILLKLVFGEMSTILLKGSRISTTKIENSGFKFLYPDLYTALKSLNF